MIPQHTRFEGKELSISEIIRHTVDGNHCCDLDLHNKFLHTTMLLMMRHWNNTFNKASALIFTLTVTFFIPNTKLSETRYLQVLSTLQLTGCTNLVFFNFKF